MFPLDDEPLEDGGLGNDGGRKCGGGGQDVNDREKSTMNLEILNAATQKMNSNFQLSVCNFFDSTIT